MLLLFNYITLIIVVRAVSFRLCVLLFSHFHSLENCLAQVFLLVFGERLVKLILILENVKECLVELAILLCLIVKSGQLRADTGSQVAELINSVIKRVTGDYLVAILCCHEVRMVPGTPLPGEKIEELGREFTFDLVLWHSGQLVEGAVNDQ